MIGFNSQNLFKLKSEARYRDTIFTEIGKGGDQNASQEILIQDENDTMIECNPKTDEAHIAEFDEHYELNKDESQCTSISELQELVAKKESNKKRISLLR